MGRTKKYEELKHYDTATEETIDLIDQGIDLDKKSEKSPSKEETSVPQTVKNGTITNALNVKVRRDPALNSNDVIEILRKGDKVKLLEKNGDFWKVQTSVNRVGYIVSNFIEEE